MNVRTFRIADEDYFAGEQRAKELGLDFSGYLRLLIARDVSGVLPTADDAGPWEEVIAGEEYVKRWKNPLYGLAARACGSYWRVYPRSAADSYGGFAPCVHDAMAEADSALEKE